MQFALTLRYQKYFLSHCFQPEYTNENHDKRMTGVLTNPSERYLLQSPPAPDVVLQSEENNRKLE